MFNAVTERGEPGLAGAVAAMARGGSQIPWACCVAGMRSVVPGVPALQDAGGYQNPVHPRLSHEEDGARQSFILAECFRVDEARGVVLDGDVRDRWAVVDTREEQQRLWVAQVTGEVEPVQVAPGFQAERVRHAHAAAVGRAAGKPDRRLAVIATRSVSHQE